MSDTNFNLEITSKNSADSATSQAIEITSIQSSNNIITPNTDNSLKVDKITERLVNYDPNYQLNRKINENSCSHNDPQACNTSAPGTSAPAIRNNNEDAAISASSSCTADPKKLNTEISNLSDSDVTISREPICDAAPKIDSTEANQFNIDEHSDYFLNQNQKQTSGDCHLTGKRDKRDSGYPLTSVNSPHACRTNTAQNYPLFASRTHRIYRALIQTDVDAELTQPSTAVALPLAPSSFTETGGDTEITISPSHIPPCVPQGPPPLAGAPPSYSAVMRIGPTEENWSYRDRGPIRIQPSPPFIAPIPPPTYSQAQGCQVERPVIIASVDQLVWGPSPISVICPRCAHVVVTTTQSQRSNLTHFSALALCLCGCWPCCLLPYCMDTCKNTYHHCPNCLQLLGMYRPW